MIVKLKRRSSSLKNVGFMWSPTVYWTEGAGAGNISEDERVQLLTQYKEWCTKFNQTPDVRIIQELESSEEQKQYALNLLEQAYKKAEENLTCNSSLGFTAHANLDALVTISVAIDMELNSFVYRDCNETYHKLSVDELKILRKDIFNAREKLKQKKIEYEKILDMYVPSNFTF